MSLEEKLNKLRAGSKDHIPEITREKMHRATKELRESGIMARALNVGDKMPAFNLPNTDGAIISSQDLLKNGSLVVAFYRGVW